MNATHIALIRGINVGKANRVAMAELREQLEMLGYRDVRTLLNSGNAVFTAPRVSARSAAARIEKVLDEELGVPARAMVLTAAELRTVVADNSLVDAETNPSRMLVAIPGDPADLSRLEPLLEQEWAPEALALGKRAAYIWCPDGLLAGRLPQLVGRALEDGVTTRNWATMLKLHALVGKAGSAP